MRNSFNVEFYHFQNGREPVKEFILEQDSKMKAKILRMIEMLSENGPELREPYSKILDEGIFELRIKQSSNISRILFFFFVEGQIILTNGFLKKTQKTPVSEIEKAKKYRKDFLERKEAGSYDKI